jgi:hypothetical protein
VFYPNAQQVSLLFFVAFFAKSQQQELINNTWYLEKLVLSNQEYYFPNIPVAGNLPKPEGKFMFYNNNSFLTRICNDFGGGISYTESKITIFGASLTLGGCPSGYDDYEGLYFGQFFGGNTVDGFFPTYDYLIENAGDYKRLTLTNPNGDTAIYNNIVLSAADFGKANDIKLFPNPAKDILNIETSLKIEKINVYDASGKVVKTFQSAGKTIDVFALKAGVYHLEIFTDKGRFYEKVLIN